MPWKPTSIPTVYPLAGLNIKASGRTQPLEMECETADGNKSYIVKLWNNVELKTHSLAREVYGSLLADYFEIPTPPIALVEIDSEFASSQRNVTIRDFIASSPGLNFGSLYIDGAIQFVPPVSPTLISQAARIFCFDMLIGNIDRRNEKANMFSSRNGLMVYDHEQAFPLSQPQTFLGRPPEPWDFIKEPWARNHILYPSLKGRELLLDIDEFVNDTGRLKDNILDKIEESIPSEWSKNLSNISLHLAKTRDNAKLFKRSLQELLA